MVSRSPNSINITMKNIIQLMAGNVEITTTEKDIKNTLTYYDLGNFIYYENLSFGYSNENFKVTTSKGNVLFRLYKQQSEENVKKEMLLMSALRRINFPTAYPLDDNEGRYIHPINNYSSLFFQFMEGKHPELNSNTAGEVGKAIGTLSILSVKDIYKKENSISIENCLNIIQEFPKAKYQYPEIFEYFKEQTDYLKKYISEELPKGIVHGDCFADNTIFNGDKLKAIIDFEEFCYETLIYDLGMTINGFCFKDNNLQNDLMLSLKHEYECLRKLTDKENELLPYYIQWAAHGMLYWHLRNNMLYTLNPTQVERVRELMNRVKNLRKININKNNR